MRILALDLGTKTGWAEGSPSGVISGTWELASSKNLKAAKKLRADRRLDIRVSSLILRLTSLANLDGDFPTKWDYLVFEDVRFASSQAQSHLWGSFRGAVWAFAQIHGIQTECLDTGKLKKFATGSGAADKSAMMRALVQKYPGNYRKEKELIRDLKTGTLLDDNAVDALHLLDWAKHILT